MEYSKMLASLATIMKQKLDVVTPLVYFAFTKELLKAVANSKKSYEEIMAFICSIDE